MNVVIWRKKYIWCTYIELEGKLEQKVWLLLFFFILQVWDCYIHFNLSQYGFNGNWTLQSIKSCHIYLRDLQRFIHNYFQFRWDITFIYYLEKGKSNHFYFFYISTLLILYKSSLGLHTHIFLLGNSACLRSSAEFRLSMEWY